MSLLAIPTAAAAIGVFLLVLIVRDIRRAERRTRDPVPGYRRAAIL